MYRPPSDQSILLQIGLLVIVVFLAGCGQEQPSQESKQPAATTSSTSVATATKDSFTLTGSSVWILTCLDGWKKNKIYQKILICMLKQPKVPISWHKH